MENIPLNEQKHTPLGKCENIIQREVEQWKITINMWESNPHGTPPPSDEKESKNVNSMREEIYRLK